MLGFFRVGGPWHQMLVQRFGPALADNIRETMIARIVAGAGPRAIAALLDRQFGVGLTWALRMVRTSMLYARRYATLATYQANSHVVQGWQWHAHFDNRVCLSCVVQHGSIHPVTEVLNDHHNGRCGMIPMTIPWEQLGVRGVPNVAPVRPGSEWFAGLSQAEQQRLMGRSMWNAWQAGQVSWQQLSTTYTDPLYGEMRRTPSLRELVGPAAARAFASQR